MTTPYPPIVWNDSIPSIFPRISSTWESTALVRSSEAAGGRVTLMPKIPWSSSGMNPAGSFPPKKTAPRATTATMRIVRIERRTRILAPLM